MSRILVAILAGVLAIAVLSFVTDFLPFNASRAAQRLIRSRTSEADGYNAAKMREETQPVMDKMAGGDINVREFREAIMPGALRADDIKRAYEVATAATRGAVISDNRYEIVPHLRRLHYRLRMYVVTSQ